MKNICIATYKQNIAEYPTILTQSSFNGPLYYVINQVILYWLSYMSKVSCIGPRQRPRTNTADLGPVTEPIQNHLINDIFIN